MKAADAQAVDPHHAPLAVGLPKGIDALAEAFLSLRTADEVVRFLRDLCTLEELQALSHRWQVARLVDQRVPYAQVAQQLGTSTTTVTRVAYWLRHGMGGYRVALDRLGGDA